MDKHGVSPDESELIMMNCIRTFLDEQFKGETRYIVYGTLQRENEKERIFRVVFTYRTIDGVVKRRIISSRPANATEIKRDLGEEV